MRQLARRWTLAVLGALVGLWLGAPAQAQQAGAPCPEQTAPGRFTFRGLQQGSPGTDGIVPAGFVAPQGMPVMHGVDVSKWQRSADFNRVKACGGSFAYVRLTAGRRPDLELEYRSHWSAARAAGLLVGPYHALTLVDAPGTWTQLTAEQQQANLKDNLTSVEQQALLFAERLREVLLLEQRSPSLPPNALGAPYLPIMLAATSRPQLQASVADRRGVSEVYRQTICRFYAVLDADPSFKGQAMGVFSFAFTYQDYGLAAAACSMAERPGWIAHHSLNGDSERREPDLHLGAAIRAMCLKPDGSNRCLFQQYTGYGSFASYTENEGLDLNRFYGDAAALQRILQLGRR